MIGRERVRDSLELGAIQARVEGREFGRYCGKRRGALPEEDLQDPKKNRQRGWQRDTAPRTEGYSDSMTVGRMSLHHHGCAAHIRKKGRKPIKHRTGHETSKLYKSFLFLSAFLSICLE